MSAAKTNLSLTDKEAQILAAVIREMDSVPSIDFEKIKDQVGHKYARNARAAFVKVWTKLKEADSASSGGNGGDGEEGGAAKLTPKSTPTKKAVGGNKTPRKASDGRAKLKTPTKKKESTTMAKAESHEDHDQENNIKPEADSNDDMDEETVGKSCVPSSPNRAFNDIVIGEDGLPEGTTDEMLRENGAIIGMTGEEYREAVKYAVKHRNCSSSHEACSLDTSGSPRSCTRAG